jgi:Holliday junction resolvase
VSTASRGAAREHRVKRLLEDEGWAVTRGAGSHGCADLWAAKRGYQEMESPFPYRVDAEVTRLRLIQVKADKRNPYDHFRPEEREALIALADQTGGTPELWWWPANKPCQILPEDVWPRAKAAA